MDLLNIFRQVSGLVNDQTRQNPSVDTDGLLGQLGNIFKQQHDTPEYDEHIGQYHGQGGYDPNYQQGGYGQQGGNQQILDASQDPYGDPADQPNAGMQQQGNILPASMDPYGDPADQVRR